MSGVTNSGQQKAVEDFTILLKSVLNLKIGLSRIARSASVSLGAYRNLWMRIWYDPVR